MTPPRLLPVIDVGHAGGRSHMTCQYRCGNACFKPVPNESDNEYFGDVVATSVSRRSMLRGGAAGVAAAGVVGVAGWGVLDPAAAAAPNPGKGKPKKPKKPKQPPKAIPLARFKGIAGAPAKTDKFRVPPAFRWQSIISWGDPVLPGAPAFDFDNQSAAAQKKQAGYNADYVALLPDSTRQRGPGRNKGVLVFNNEYTNDELMFRGVESAADLTDEQLNIVKAAHGMTIVEVKRRGPALAWKYKKNGRRNRRIHADTVFAVDGPAAGHPALRTSADPAGRKILGTLNNCAGGTTPWGTILSGEENFNQYFDTTDAPDPKGRLKRYGLTSAGRGWERVDQRFKTAQEPNEVNRFGWIVEVDPDNPKAKPVKHTAMGRFKHEGATTRIADDGRVVAYMGDDERFDYIYKFVSRKKYKPGNKGHNKTLLAQGDLYVAKFHGDGAADGEYDGTGNWIPLVVNGRSHVEGWTVAQVLIWTRQAADQVGPTKMDRPEDVEANPATGKVYAALTNNTAREADDVNEPNPRGPNKHGHVIEISERRNDAAAHTFTWKIVLLAGDPNDESTYFHGYDGKDVSPISCPDNVAFDSKGHLWISTDGQPGTLGVCDGLFMLPLHGPDTGKLKQFLSVPAGAECCGPYVMADDRAVLVAVQHPGEIDGATPDNPASTFPYKGDGQPRPGVVQVLRKKRRKK